MAERKAETSNRLREGRVRGEAAHQGLRLEKSRSGTPHASEYGAYRLTDIATNVTVAFGPGGGCGLTLDDVERALGITTPMTNPLNAAAAKALWARLADSVNDVAAARRATSDAHMPDGVRQHILAMRQQLREAGIPDEQIDTTPGLEPPDAIDDQ